MTTTIIQVATVAMHDRPLVALNAWRAYVDVLVQMSVAERQSALIAFGNLAASCAPETKQWLILTGTIIGFLPSTHARSLLLVDRLHHHGVTK